MAERKVGAAVVLDPDGRGPGIITERDMLDAVGAGEDPDTERVGDHLTADIVFAAPDWSLEEAAVAMVRGGFRHLVVIDGGELAGILSMRDIVRCWTDDGAICDVPASARLRRGGERSGALRRRGAARAAQCARAAARRCSRRVSRDPAHDHERPSRITPTIDEREERRDADEGDRDADRQQQRLDARAGEVDLLAGGRDARVERAHPARRSRRRRTSCRT